MNIEQFLAHHGLHRNPFAGQDAQGDEVFQDGCIGTTFHPAWRQVCGNFAEPTPAIVFGESGTGKTALRLQLARQVAQHNGKFPDRRALLIAYDAFQPFFEHFRGNVRRKCNPARLLSQWKLADHLDAILSLAVTRLVDCILQTPRPRRAADVEPVDIAALTRAQAANLLSLAACYDACPVEPPSWRWQRLQKTLRYSTPPCRWETALGAGATLAWPLASAQWAGMGVPWAIFAAASWLPWIGSNVVNLWRARGLARQLRVMRPRVAFLRKVLWQFSRAQLDAQIWPGRDRGAERIALLQRLRLVAQALGYRSLVIVVDRVESAACSEASGTNGLLEQAFAFVKTLLDPRLFDLPGIGFKLFLPAALRPWVERDPQLAARLSWTAQGCVAELAWSGATLYDIATARLKACALNGRPAMLRDLFDGTVTESRLVETLGRLSGPRDVNRLLDRALQIHAARHTDATPVWRIPLETLAAALAEQS